METERFTRARDPGFFENNVRINDNSGKFSITTLHEEQQQFRRSVIGLVCLKLVFFYYILALSKTRSQHEAIGQQHELKVIHT